MVMIILMKTVIRVMVLVIKFHGDHGDGGNDNDDD